MYLIFWYSPLADDATKALLQKETNLTEAALKDGWVLGDDVFDYILQTYSYDPKNYLIKRFLEWLGYRDGDGVQIILCDENVLPGLMFEAQECLSFVSDFELNTIRMREWLLQAFLLTEATKGKEMVRKSTALIKKQMNLNTWEEIHETQFNLGLNFDEEYAKLYHRFPTDLIADAYEAAKNHHPGMKKLVS